MRILALMGLVTIALASGAYAGDKPDHGDCQGDQCKSHEHDGDQDQGKDKDKGECQGPECTPPTRPVCFNLVCYYHADDKQPWDVTPPNGAKRAERFHECKAATTFIKNVSIDGGEVQDVSLSPNNPTLEISCDDNPIPVYNNSSYRATDLLGTVIQAQAGPDPQLRLPRGELHTGIDNNLSGEHVSPSELLISPSEAAHDDIQRMRGNCYIWTGNP